MPRRRKDLLYLVADDLRAELPAYGRAHMRTPHLDALAASSTVFERAYCQLARCAPSRMSFLTGRGPQTTRVLTSSPQTDRRSHASVASTRSAACLPQGAREASWAEEAAPVDGVATPPAGERATAPSRHAAAPPCVLSTATRLAVPRGRYRPTRRRARGFDPLARLAAIKAVAQEGKPVQRGRGGACGGEGGREELGAARGDRRVVEPDAP